LPKLCDIGGAIKLDNFPGAFYRMKQHIKAATIYSSGKITLIGGRSREDLEKAMIYLQKTLRNFTK
jgi:TATA-box binding protein (TBP) (component of TFIID and TFIIIB)